MVPKTKSTSTNQESLARGFAKLMFQGKTKEALCLITEQNVGGIIGSRTDASCSVHDALLTKHPPGQPDFTNALYNTTPEPPTVHPVVFDATTIKTAALCTDGAAGPSGIDARDDCVHHFTLPQFIYVAL